MDGAQEPNAPASTSRRAQSRRLTAEAQDEEARSRKKEEAARRADDTRRDRSGRPGGSRDSPGQYGAARDLGNASGGADARDHERHLVERARARSRTSGFAATLAGTRVFPSRTGRSAPTRSSGRMRPNDARPCHRDERRRIVQRAVCARRRRCSGHRSGRPRNTERPSIVGTAQVGQTADRRRGQLDGQSDRYTYQWQRCDADVASCAAVIGATGKTYGVRLADLGFRLRVAVTARNARGSATVNSPITRDRGACGQRSRTGGRRSRSSRSGSRGHACTRASGSATTRPGTRRFSPPTRVRASPRTRAGSRRSCRRARAASTRGTGCRCCASAARAGTPSRSAPATPRA